MEKLEEFFRSQVKPQAIEALRKGSQVAHDKGQGDLVGELDLRIDALLAEFLPLLGYGSQIVSEENIGDGNLTKGAVWLVDPLDGTNTMQSGVPMFGTMCVLIVEGQPVFSAIYLPLETLYDKSGFYFAASGHGACEYALFGTAERRDVSSALPLMVSSTDVLSKATLLLEGPSRGVMTSAVTRALVESVRKVRMVQAACWSSVLVARASQHPAAGADLLLGLDFKPWDSLPGCLLIEEAGGRVTDLDGNPWSVDNCTRLLFSNGKVHDAALEAIRRGVLQV